MKTLFACPHCHPQLHWPLKLVGDPLPAWKCINCGSEGLNNDDIVGALSKELAENDPVEPTQEPLSEN